MILGDVLNSGALPALELSLRFAARRQEQIAHNIANLTTPGFQVVETSPAGFQSLLARAIDERRQATGGMAGELAWRPTREVQRSPGGGLRLVPRTPGPGILAHDRNNRDLERLMQDHAENVSFYRVTSELLRNQQQQIRDAIGERV